MEKILTNQELKNIILQQQIQIKELDDTIEELERDYHYVMEEKQELRFELFDAEELVKYFKNELVEIFGISKYYELLN